MKKMCFIISVLFFSFNTVFGQTRKDSLIVFIGEIIEIKYSPETIQKKPAEMIIEGSDTSYIENTPFIFDNRYIAKYKVLEILNGTYKADTIEFIAFDHYGQPGFSDYKNVLLFVSMENGKLYHEKYQYYDLYKAENDKWASPYSALDYNHPFKDSITVKPEIINFKNNISFSINKLTKDQIRMWYPKPYYSIKNKHAIPIYGNYVDDLLKLKQQTILKARGIY